MSTSFSGSFDLLCIISESDADKIKKQKEKNARYCTKCQPHLCKESLSGYILSLLYICCLWHCYKLVLVMTITWDSMKFTFTLIKAHFECNTFPSKKEPIQGCNNLGETSPLYTDVGPTAFKKSCE